MNTEKISNSELTELVENDDWDIIDDMYADGRLNSKLREIKITPLEEELKMQFELEIYNGRTCELINQFKEKHLEHKEKSTKEIKEYLLNT